MYRRGDALGYDNLLEEANEMTILYMSGLDTSQMTPVEYVQKFFEARKEINNYFRTENGYDPE